MAWPAASFTALRKCLPALGFVLAGLLGRALIDRALAAQGGAVGVAGWAQLSNVAEVIAGVSLTGVGTALTVLAAGKSGDDRLAWLKPAMAISMVLSLAVALLAFGLFLWLDKPLVPAEGPTPILAALTGWCSIAPGLAVALLLGLKCPGRATVIAALGYGVPMAFLAWAPWPSPLSNLLAGQAAFGLAFSLGLLVFLRKQPPVSLPALRTLLHFVPAGLAIGILSPLTTALARSELAASLSWQAAGQVQAIWRATDWITAIMAGLLNAYFLPRLSGRSDRQAFLAELSRAFRWTLLPAAVLLTALWLFLPEVLALLYRTEISVSREDALFFLLGDWVRISSWGWLFGLFARRAAWAIAWGELLSLPLFWALLALSAGHFGLREVGMLWLVSYLVYAGFNATALKLSLEKFRYPPVHPAQR